MELTAEQIAIINSTGNIKINAVAGSGKTTTIIEYAKARPKNSSILYLAFNRSVKLEAVKKFEEKRLGNVKIETAHSLAYKHVVFRNSYKVRAQGYKTYEIAELLGLQASGEKHAEHIVASHINKFITYFCNSNKPRVQDLNYLDVVTDVKARIFVTSFYEYIEAQTRLLLSKMNTGEIEITHDFYLKKFQLMEPRLNYDYILFDEGQDASAAMLDLFLKQQAVKVIVGDTHQQIYGWRYAVNSIEKADFATFHLSTSFRFRQDIANLATGVLAWKEHLQPQVPVTITGLGKRTEVKTKAVLARTNLGLLLKAIEYVTERKSIKHIYFEGNINSYTYAAEGASLYDVLSLYNNRHSFIKDKLVGAMKNMRELEEYIEKTEDVQLGMMVEVVKEYGNTIPGIIKSIKDKHVPNDEKDKAEIIFSTVHRCKGMEYDAVQLVNDFITEEKLEKQKAEAKESGLPLNTSKLNEEINLLYVAVTRTRNILHIPASLVPKGFEASSQIHVTKVQTEEEKWEAEQPRYQPAFGKKTGRQTVVIKMTLKPTPKNRMVVKDESQKANAPWTSEHDEELTLLYCERKSIKELAEHFKRTRGAIRARIKKLELQDLYG